MANSGVYLVELSVSGVTRQPVPSEWVTDPVRPDQRVKACDNDPGEKPIVSGDGEAF